MAEQTLLTYKGRPLARQGKITGTATDGDTLNRTA